jgi:hypothetical protein
MTKSWSFVEMQNFIEQERPDKKQFAYDYVFYKISNKTENEVLADFDKWVEENSTLPLRRKISRLLMRIALKL